MSHMDIDGEEKKDLKDDCTNPSSSRLSIEPTGPMAIPRDVTMIKTRTTWLHDTF
jgi:hypothetical protein